MWYRALIEVSLVTSGTALFTRWSQAPVRLTQSAQRAMWRVMGELNYPVVERLNKGLMTVPSPTSGAPSPAWLILGEN
eukprot:1195672-Prorocentrum_minimum.AAC.3